MTGAAPGRSAVFIAFAGLLALVSVPLFSTVLPPLVDYPNHIARFHLLAEGGNAFYAVRWAPLPDLAGDLIVPALATVLPLAKAGKLFLIITFALLAGGTLWLNRAATGRWQAWPMLAFLLLYNRSFLWGFLNYLFGLGMALCALAAWLSLERRPTWQRVGASSLLALACFVSHLAAIAVYAVALAGIEAFPALAQLRAGEIRAIGRRTAIAAAQFVVPAVLFCFFQPRSAGGAISYGQIWRKFDLLFGVFDNYSRPFDVLCFVLFAGLLAGLAWSRRLHVEARPGLAVALVFAVYLLLPNQIYTGSGADHRLPLAIFLLLLGASEPRLGSRSGQIVAAVAAAMVVVRLAVIEMVWLDAGRRYAADIAAIDHLPAGARLAVAFPGSEVNAGGIPELHVAALAAWRRGTFVPTVFAHPAQQPLALRPPYDALAEATSPDRLWAAFVGGDAAALRQVQPVLRRYEFIVFADRRATQVPPHSCLRPLPSPPQFRLFALDPAADCTR